jgi:hypothetical protein
MNPITGDNYTEQDGIITRSFLAELVVTLPRECLLLMADHPVAGKH